MKLFGTDNPRHPGVNKVLAGGDYIIGGKIELLQRTSNNLKHYELTPTQTRMIFESLNWKKIVGFHTRNVIHRSHEFIQLEAVRLLHPQYIRRIIANHVTNEFFS